MNLVEAGSGPGKSINPGNGGPDEQDDNKVTIDVMGHIDTPRPNRIFSNQEIVDLQLQDRFDSF